MASPRHSLARLAPAGWASVRLQVPDRHHAAIDRCSVAGWPAVVRRQEDGCPSHQVCIGIALPPDPASAIKHRLPVRVDAQAIADLQPPRSLASVLCVMPARWQDGLMRLQAELSKQQLSLSVFGSAALQAVTGLPYLHATSDLDLLLQPVSLTQLETGLQLLTHYSRELPLDGEIIFPSGDAVAWKEWGNARRQSASSRVLVKRPAGVALMRTDILLATLEQNLCTR